MLDSLSGYRIGGLSAGLERTETGLGEGPRERRRVLDHHRSDDEGNAGVFLAGIDTTLEGVSIVEVQPDLDGEDRAAS